MKISVYDIRKEIGAYRTFSFEEEIDLDEENSSSISAQITLTNTGKNILASGEIKAAVNLTCSRCLQNSIQVIDVPIMEQFSDDAEYVLNSSEAAENLEEINIYSDNIIDLGDVFRQNIILSFPLKPLCKEECLGLCQTCGKNLNENRCGCK